MENFLKKLIETVNVLHLLEKLRVSQGPRYPKDLKYTSTLVCTWKGTDTLTNCNKVEHDKI